MTYPHTVELEPAGWGRAYILKTKCADNETETEILASMADCQRRMNAVIRPEWFERKAGNC